ncbi:MAG TPA: 4Fe-4S dicluster domain-containing protein, partial [bacterium]|nr:4Fe-4S dicluster domain-containing protein [bacterium]
VRDLQVDRTRFFEDLKRVKPWIPVDGYYDLGEGPRVSPLVQGTAYVLSTCMTCGCCLEACPQYGPHSDFVGAAVISQARLFNLHPTGKAQAPERIEALMQPGGLEDCGNAQNCVEVCPKEIPLTASIADMNRQATWYAIKNFFTGNQ